MDGALTADWDARIRASFGRQTFMAAIGADVTRVQPGQVDIDLPFRADLGQQHGFVHAGVVTAIADTACGYAALTLMEANAAVLTTEFKINLLAPAAGERFRARARVLRTGRTLSVCSAEVTALSNGSEKVVAVMLATMMSVRDRPGLTD